MKEFEHPSLKRFNATIPALELMGSNHQSQGVEDIYRLMVMIDHFRTAEWEAGGSMSSEGEFAWEPKSPELTELIAHLIAPEQRIGLKAWFSTQEEMNLAAVAFREWLANRINESLKPW